MDTTTLISRLEAASSSFHNLERQLADPDVAADPQRLETIARERSRLEPLVLDYASLQKVEAEQVQAKSLLKESRGDAAMEELAQQELQELDRPPCRSDSKDHLGFVAKGSQRRTQRDAGNPSWCWWR
jgi:peptide chain release factor 1